jgi:V8-like Glu-specific endopeptidase
MRPCSQSARSRLASSLAALACLAMLTALAPAEVGASARLNPPSAGTSASIARGEAARVASYWTPARMRSTPPLDGGAGGAKSESTASVSFATVLDATLPPYSVNGRIFLRQGDARGYCSGTAIDSPTRQLVLTAAHCLNSGPLEHSPRTIWSRTLLFVPAYRNGVAPFGVFVARRSAIFAPKAFVKTGNPDYDVGAFLTLPNAAGQNVADAVGGGVAIVIDRPRDQQFQTFGYPATQRTLQQCDSPYVGDDVLTYRFAGPPTIAIRCRWTPGASGGGWLVDEGTAINGVTSYGHRGDRRHTFSPYFASGNVGALVAGL